MILLRLSTSSGSTQRPRRSTAIASARSGPATPQKISTTCARPMMRAAIGMRSPFSPAGCPPPSQCSSIDCTACAVASDMPSARAMAALRAQRIEQLALGSGGRSGRGGGGRGVGRGVEGGEEWGWGQGRGEADRSKGVGGAGGRSCGVAGPRIGWPGRSVVMLPLETTALPLTSTCGMPSE